MTSFSELKKQNPLSFRLFEQWVEQNYETTLNIWNGTIRNEDVVLFMDDKNINIQISVKCSLDGRRWYLPYIWSEADGCDMDEHLSDSSNRTFATVNAITKAFELLENKLKQN